MQITTPSVDPNHLLSQYDCWYGRCSSPSPCTNPHLTLIRSSFQVQRRSDGKTYALKRVNISKMKQAEVADTLNEIRFLASIKHPYVVGFLEAFLDRGDSELCIIMEYCSYGDLAEKVRSLFSTP